MKFIWKILHTNLDLKRGVEEEPPIPGPCTLPFEIGTFVLDFPCEFFAKLPDYLPVASFIFVFVGESRQ